jgi:hypothetical protein
MYLDSMYGLLVVSSSQSAHYLSTSINNKGEIPRSRLIPTPSCQKPPHSLPSVSVSVKIW